MMIGNVMMKMGRIGAAMRKILQVIDSVSRVAGANDRKFTAKRLRPGQILPDSFGLFFEVRMAGLSKIASALLLMLAVPVFAADAPTPAVAAQDGDYVLDAGDRIRLSLYGDDSFKGEFAVSDNGTISLPLIGALPARGMTVNAFRATVETKLADGYYRDPRLSAEVVNYRPFYILGEVNKPGQYPYVTGMTLGQAVAIANGYTLAARKGTIAIRRAKSQEEVKISANPALPIGPGDTVRVLERLF